MRGAFPRDRCGRDTRSPGIAPETRTTLAVVPRNHPPAGGGLFDRRVDLIAGGQHVIRRSETGRPNASRSRRWNAAVRARSNAGGGMRDANGASSVSASRVKAARRTCPFQFPAAPPGPARRPVPPTAPLSTRRRSPRAPRASATRRSSSRTMASTWLSNAGVLMPPAREVVSRAMARSICAASGVLRGGGASAGSLLRNRQRTYCTSPVVEEIENVRLAELDPNRTTARPFGVVAFAVLIDPPKRDLQRHAPRRPSADLLERRSDNANQVPLVLLAKVSFDFAAVVCRGHWIKGLPGAAGRVPVA